MRERERERTSARGEGLDAALPPHLVERERERVKEGGALARVCASRLIPSGRKRERGRERKRQRRVKSPYEQRGGHMAGGRQTPLMPRGRRESDREREREGEREREMRARELTACYQRKDDSFYLKANEADQRTDVTREGLSARGWPSMSTASKHEPSKMPTARRTCAEVCSGEWCSRNCTLCRRWCSLP